MPEPRPQGSGTGQVYARDVSERLKDDQAGLSGPVRLDELFQLYRAERLPETRGKHRRENERQMKMWQAYLGGSCDVRGFSRREWDHFCHARSGGRVNSQGQPVARPNDRRPVSKRTVAKDLAFLRTVFKWATEWRDPRSRQFLLEKNPTRGLPLPKEPNPKRPIMTDGRFLKLLEAAPKVTMRVGHGKKANWVKTPLEVLLAVAEGTGARIGAIVQLRWSDWLPDRGRYGSIRWRADSDKIGFERTIPVTRNVREAIEAWRKDNPGLGETPIFRQPNNPSQYLRVDQTRRWFLKAEELAGLKHMQRGMWHMLRRKWGTERKSLPLRDVAYAGGWKDPTTLLKVYQQPDPETVEHVVLEPRKLRQA